MDRFEKFQQVTGYDIKSFFQKFVDFCNNNYPSIVDYYSGSGIIPGDAFNVLLELDNQSHIIEPLFILHENTLDDISMWDILDDFTEVQTKIATVKASSRWLRSSTLDKTNTIQLKKSLRTGENFEDVSREMSDMEPQNDWMDITVPQYIEEEQYSFANGSRIFSINLQNAGGTYVDTIVDTLVGENVLGRDIDVNFIFENDDLKLVISEDALKQALKIILEALKGSIPEFKEYGIANEFIGTTVNAIQYPSIFKNLMNMFQRDSRWTSVELLDIYRQEDSIFLKIKAQSVTNTDYLVNVPV